MISDMAHATSPLPNLRWSIANNLNQNVAQLRFMDFESKWHIPTISASYKSSSC